MWKFVLRLQDSESNYLVSYRVSLYLSNLNQQFQESGSNSVGIWQKQIFLEFNNHPQSFCIIVSRSMYHTPEVYITSKWHTQTFETPFLSRRGTAWVVSSLFQHHMQPQADLGAAAAFASIWEKAAALELCCLLDMLLVLLCYMFNVCP